MSLFADILGRALAEALPLIPSPAGNRQAAVEQAIQHLCDVVDRIGARLGVVEHIEASAAEGLEQANAGALAVARVFAEWLSDADRDHACEGTGCWWCLRRGNLADRIARALGEVAETKTNQRRGRRPRKPVDNQRRPK